MDIIHSVDEMQKTTLALKRESKVIGFVPTMGYLHKGHVSLIRRARPECDVLVVSIYVNPTQFAPTEDLKAYPRDFGRDKSLCEKAGADIVFNPDNDEMYPQGYLTDVHVRELGKLLCGKSRPAHFDGVATVVAKLFNIVQPDVAVFGQKDAQQAVVIRRMARDLNFPVRIIVAPTVREDDGLAMSSRNEYLTGDERNVAPALYRSLELAEKMIKSGRGLINQTPTSDSIIAAMREHILAAGPFELDYIEIVDPENLTPVEYPTGRKVLIVLAARLGKARLIDNIIVGD